MRRIGGDQIRIKLATIVSLTLLSTAVRADWDVSVGALTRSYPISAFAYVDGGYDQLLWGQHDGHSPWYGYVRPNFELGSVGTYNSATAAVDLNPISFVGFSAGEESIQNDSDYSAYNCDLYTCRGRFYRKFIQGQLSLGYGPVISQWRWRREHWSRGRPGTLEFIESTGGISLAAGGDSETIYRGMLGYKLTPEWTVMAAITVTQSDLTHEQSRFPAALGRFTKGDFSFGFGAGMFSSNLKLESFSAMFFAAYDLKPDLSLK